MHRPVNSVNCLGWCWWAGKLFLGHQCPQYKRWCLINSSSVLLSATCGRYCPMIKSTLFSPMISKYFVMCVWVYFRDTILMYWLGRASTCHSPASASQLTEISSMCHHAQQCSLLMVTALWFGNLFLTAGLQSADHTFQRFKLLNLGSDCISHRCFLFLAFCWDYQ